MDKKEKGPPLGCWRSQLIIFDFILNDFAYAKHIHAVECILDKQIT